MEAEETAEPSKQRKHMDAAGERNSWNGLGSRIERGAPAAKIAFVHENESGLRLRCEMRDEAAR